ncbi:hypothetical protein BDN72DRAFT_848752 [Pluteus cervinus]|uniref:Uncharacterized protein n=1 Tax=Pluteus cervinus TaxID=181527 RepID=A0ACD3A9U3_9AGAR|nr:hypothetical protein BDN72DRAFT_848752 [Pluteus cervinus]
MELTQVCSRWRAVAFATPKIWQDLKCAIYLSADKNERQETQSFIQDWISRARNMPLSIVAIPLDLRPDVEANPSYFPRLNQPFMRNSVRMQPVSQDPGLPQWVYANNKFNLLKDIIIPNSPKIRDLHITLPSYYRHSFALLKQEVDFPLLEDFTLNIATSTRAPTRYLVRPLPVSPQYALLNNTPRLRKFKSSLNFSDFHITSHTQFQIDWSRITHFEAGPIPASIFLQTLCQTRCLQYCKASLEADSPMTLLAAMQTVGKPGSRSCNTHLPNLKVLSLTADTWNTLAPLILKDTIALSEFRLSVYGRPDRHPTTMRDFLCLPALSQLTHLVNNHVPGGWPETINQDAVDAIAGGHIVPHLHTLHFEGGLSGISGESIVNLLMAKGFVSPSDGSTIFPDPAGSKRVTTSHLGHAGSVGAPFQQVKIYGLTLDEDDDLYKIQEQVGSECLVLEMLEMDKWDLLNQIEWEEDE